MRAAALDLPAVDDERALRLRLLGVEPLGVLDPLEVEALEPGVEVVVVRTLPGGAEAHRQEQRVDPVDLVLADEQLDERPGDPEDVAAGLLAVPAPDLLVDEVEDDPLALEVEQDLGADPRADLLAEAHQRLEPGLELGQQVERLGVRVAAPALVLGVEQRAHPGLVLAQVGLAVVEDPADLGVGQRVDDVERRPVGARRSSRAA